MVTIVAKNIFKKGCLENALPLLDELIAKSRAESGCIRYELYQDTENPAILTFIEDWQDEKAIEVHNSSEHFTRIVPKLQSFTEDHDVVFYRRFR